MLALAPFSHVMGFVITLGSALLAGAPLVPVPRFDPTDFIELLARERVSIVIVPPPVMPLLARSPHDLPDVELIVCGGAPLGAELQLAVAERFPHAAVGQGWGLTETTANGTLPDRERGTEPGSCGRLMPNTELRVLDSGELLLRGPQVMAGYLNRPDATAELIDADGWVHTGDAGRIDHEGNVFIVDRLKELIKVNALQVAPAELEAVLVTHPAVAECAVDPAARRALRRGAGRGHRAPRGGRRRGADGMGRGARRPAQAPARGALHRHDPADAGGEDPPPAAPEPRDQPSYV